MDQEWGGQQGELSDATFHPEGGKAVDAAYAAIAAFPPCDQVPATSSAMVAVLRTMGEQSENVYEARTAFNGVRDEALAYLQQQMAGLGLPTARRTVG